MKEYSHWYRFLGWLGRISQPWTRMRSAQHRWGFRQSQTYISRYRFSLGGATTCLIWCRAPFWLVRDSLLLQSKYLKQSLRHMLLPWTLYTSLSLVGMRTVEAQALLTTIRLSHMCSYVGWMAHGRRRTIPWRMDISSAWHVADIWTWLWRCFKVFIRVCTSIPLYLLAT